MSRERADRLLVHRGLATSREQAQALIAGGHVLANGRKVAKPSQQLPQDSELQLDATEPVRVSRAGAKLDHALTRFQLDVSDCVSLDIGASTGGFTEVLLRRGARRVYAVDVGHNQLAPILRADPRVVCQEGVNARYLTQQEIPEEVDALVCDASFISLAKVLEKAISFVRPGGFLVTLVKPQFEVGRTRVGKGGLVRDPVLHREVCDAAADWLTTRTGWQLLGLIDSPITGGEGNREFLMAGRRED